METDWVHFPGDTERVFFLLLIELSIKMCNVKIVSAEFKSVVSDGRHWSVEKHLRVLHVRGYYQRVLR